jgi:dihydroxy-acid dehydratase
MVSRAGARIVEMVWEDLTPARILDRASFLNGLVAYMALGGSTNAAVHLIAMARRAGVALSLDDMAETAGRVPVCANLFPSGRYLMEDFWFAGGLLALLRKLSRHLDLARPTVNGRSLGENIVDAECFDHDVIRGEDDPVVPLSRGKTLTVLRGNLAPRGAVMKASAADPRFLRHVGPALVFDSPGEMMRAIDDEALDVTPDTVLVLRNAGPVGAPGMPEWGNLPIPKKLLREGVRDMVRICDGRMSGTHYGTCILHVTPEAAVGGPLGLLRTGDLVALDVAAGRIDMQVPEEELARRRAAFAPSAPVYARSWAALYQRHVGQADEGCDFDFLEAGAPTPEPAIY